MYSVAIEQCNAFSLYVGTEQQLTCRQEKKMVLSVGMLAAVIHTCAKRITPLHPHTLTGSELNERWIVNGYDKVIMFLFISVTSKQAGVFCS